VVTFSAIVADAGPLIHLARINKLDLLHALFKEIYIPNAVKTETVDRGKNQGYVDAIAIEKAISSGWVKVAQIKPNAENLAKEANISIGEAEAIILAKQMETTKLLIDDARARKIAQTLGLKPHGTIYVLKLALVKKIISKKEYRQSLQKAINTGLYLTTELYMQALKNSSALERRLNRRRRK